MAGWLVAAFSALILLKPTALWPGLEGVPVVHLAFGLVVLGCAVDALRGRLAPRLAPATWLVGALFAWGLATTAVKAPAMLPAEISSLSILGAVYLAVAVGAASPRGLVAFATAYVACAATVTVIAIVQSHSDPRCFAVDARDRLWEIGDGRTCTSSIECQSWSPEPAELRCERPGPWQTTSIGFRARFRGSLADPNELSVMTVTSLPFVLLIAGGARRGRRDEDAPRSSRRRAARLPVLLGDRTVGGLAAFARAVPAAVMFAAVAWVVVLTRSRTGVIVYLVVAGIELTRRFGAWAVVGGCFVAPPVLLLGGRSGQEASDSSDERMQLLVEALDMVRRTRGLGVGLGRFVDESDIGLTAHNSFVLAAAEAGLVGMVLFGLVLYAGTKTSVVAWLDERPLDPVVRRVAPALTTSLVGAAVGSFFLSWTFKDVLYVLLGGAGALFAVASPGGERLAARPTWREVVAVGGAMMALLAAVSVASRLAR